MEKGYGTENQPDTGSPASVMLASWRRRLTAWPMRRKKPEIESTMPNAKKESDPLEEGQTTETNQQFYDMQER